MASTGLEPNNTIKTIGAKTVAELATYQTKQIGNNCSMHAISAGIKILINYKIDPQSLTQEINQLWWRGRFMRVLPNWAVTPRMQVCIIEHLAKSRNLPIRSSFQNGTVSELKRVLSEPLSAALITLIWLWGQAPPIYYADSHLNTNKTVKAQGHTMVLAAYNPNHSSGSYHTPWGFINSWRNNAQSLYWMAEADFLKAWQFSLPGIGQNPLVLLQNKSFKTKSN